MKKTHLFFSLLFCLFMLYGVAAESFGETPVSGIIISDTTWTCENSPYIVTESVLVTDGVTLTIEPCVTVRFNAGTALSVDGTLIAKGTNSNKITFTSAQTAPAPGDWGYIFFSDLNKDATFDQDGNYTGGSILEYTIVEYAGGVINISNNGAVRMNNAYPFINNCIIRNNDASGIRGWNLFSRKLKIANSEIYSNTASQANGGGGINISGIADILNSTIDNNTVNIQGTCSGCGGGGIYAEGNITLSNNVISNNTAGSGGGIYAKSLKAGYGVTISNNSIIRNIAENSPAVNYIAGDNKNISNNTITNNTATGAAPTYTVYMGSFPFFNYNNIFANSAIYELWNNNMQGLKDLNTENNWWGVFLQPEIEGRIFHYIDDPAKAVADYSLWDTAIRTDAPVSPPSGLAVTAGTGQVVLTWTANQEPDIAGYKIYWDTDPGRPYANSADAGNTGNYAISGLSAGTYYFTVTAYDAAYNSANDAPDTIVNENQTNGNESWYAEESCNDGVSAISAKLNYYRDADKDTFGDPAETLQSCTPPQGYVTDDTDCNDSNALEFPGQTWYKDEDNDWYSDGTMEVSCNRPSIKYKTLPNLTAVTGDCKDADKSVNPGAVEGPPGEITCLDGKDNDCDSLQDYTDPDCISAGLDLFVISVSNLPASSRRGSDFTVSYTVLNQGETRTGRSRTLFYLSTDTVKNDNDIPLKNKGVVPKLNSGKSLIMKNRVTISKGTTPGYYYVIACADSINRIVESNEDNNCTASKTTLLVK